MSIINYGIELYAKNRSVWIEQLQKCQNRLLKILTNNDRFTKTNYIHKKFNILKIEDHAKLRHLLIEHKFFHFPEQRNSAYRNMVINTRAGRNLRDNNNYEISALDYSRNNKIIEKDC